MALSYTSFLVGISENVYDKEAKCVYVWEGVEIETEVGRQRENEMEIIKQGKGAWEKWNNQREQLVSRHQFAKRRRFSSCSGTSGM